MLKVKVLCRIDEHGQEGQRQIRNVSAGYETYQVVRSQFSPRSCSSDGSSVHIDVEGERASGGELFSRVEASPDGA